MSSGFGAKEARTGQETAATRAARFCRLAATTTAARARARKTASRARALRSAQPKPSPSNPPKRTQPTQQAVIVFGATGTVGHALVKMLKAGHLGMQGIKVVAVGNDKAACDKLEKELGVHTMCKVGPPVCVCVRLCALTTVCALPHPDGGGADGGCSGVTRSSPLNLNLHRLSINAHHNRTRPTLTPSRRSSRCTSRRASSG